MSKKKVTSGGGQAKAKANPRTQMLLERLVSEDPRLEPVHRRALMISTKGQSTRDDTTSMGEETRNIYRQHLKA